MIVKQYDIISNNKTLKGTLYLPDNDAKGIIEIVHGMAEHRQRYDDFCKFLSKHNYIVYIYDQLGHGETALNIESLGYMDDKDNLEAMLKDVKKVNEELNNSFNKENNLKFYLLGHSMGSFISQRYLQLYNDSINGLILSGTNYTKSFLYSLGRPIAKTVVLLKGRKHKSKFLDKMSFGSYNKQIKNNKTDFDWLSLNEENVYNYIKDPYCGTLFSASYFYDLLKLFKKINKGYKKINCDKNLPIYLFSGECDPVGNMGKGVKKLYNQLNKIGFKNLDMKLYKNYRHEMLNEVNKEEVYNNLLVWLDKFEN